MSALRLVPQPAPVLVFAVTLPLALAPLLNTYAASQPWQRAKVRAGILAAFSAVASQWPAARLGIVRGMSTRRGMVGPVVLEGNARRRRVVIERRSSVRPDEVSADACGGKQPIDCLVRCGILRDDNAQWCEREARWVRAAPGKGIVIVEVYEV